jgi:large subunit ribosomal protein L25
LPTAIPKHIEVDVSGLDIGDAVHVGDVPLPEGVELADPSEDSREMVVASVTVVVEEEVEEVVEEAAGQPEVIGKGKEEEGEDKDKDKDKDKD